MTLSSRFRKFLGAIAGLNPPLDPDTPIEILLYKISKRLNDYLLPIPGQNDSGKVPIVKTDGTYELSKFENIFTLRGVVAAVENLPASNNEIGDVYYVESVSAGYVWIETETSPNGYWEELGETFTLTPAAVVSVTSSMTDQQASDTLGNIGGEPKRMIVTITSSGNTYSSDKTFAQIRAAVLDKKDVIIKYGSVIFTLQENELSYVQFRSVFYNNSQESYIVSTFTISSTDFISFNYTKVKGVSSIVTDTLSTNITLENAADNTIYEYGELASLTIVSISNPGDFIIRFTSGATATTTSFPVGMKFQEAFAAEANTRYEINCSNGYALAVGWPAA